MSLTHSVAMCLSQNILIVVTLGWEGERQKEWLSTAGGTQTSVATMKTSVQVSIALIKYHDLKQHKEGRVCLFCTSMLQSVTEGNQGRNSRQEPGGKD